MNPMLFIHLFSLGIWLGCVMAETVIEIAGKKNPLHQNTVALLHVWIDRWVEIPAFIAVLASGLALFKPEKFHGIYAAKIIFGLIAIAINIYCAWWVRHRARHPDRFVSDSRQIYATFFLGIPAGLAALALGLRMLNIL